MHPNIKYLREGDLLVCNQKDYPNFFNIDRARGKTNILVKIISLNDRCITISYKGGNYKILFSDIPDNYFDDLNKIIGNNYSFIATSSLVEKVLSNLHKKYKTVKIYVNEHGDQCSPRDAEEIVEASFTDDGKWISYNGKLVAFNYASYAGKDIAELPTKIYNLTSDYNSSVNYNTSLVCWANDFQNFVVNHFFQNSLRDNLHKLGTSLEENTKVKETDMKPDVYTELSKLPKDFKFVLSFKNNPSLLSFYSDRYRYNKKTICTIDSVDPRDKYTVFKAPGIHAFSVEKRWVEKETLENVIPTSWHITDIDLDNIYAKHITKFAKEHDDKIEIYVNKDNRPCPIQDAVEIKEVKLNNINNTNNTLSVILDNLVSAISPSCYAGETGDLPKIVLGSTQNYHTHPIYKNIDVTCYSNYDKILYKNGKAVDGGGQIFQKFQKYADELRKMPFKEDKYNSQVLKNTKEVAFKELKVGDKFIYGDSGVECEVLDTHSEGILLKSSSPLEDNNINKYSIKKTLASFRNVGWKISKEACDKITPDDNIIILRNGLIKKINLLLANKTETKIEGDTMTSINDKKAKPAETKESLMSVFAKDFDKAKYRTAATTTTKLARKAMLNFFASKGLSDEKNGKAIAELVDSALGESLMRALVGQALTYAPGIKEDERAKKLAKEFRVSGFATAGDAVFDKIKEIAMPALTSVMASLPTEQTATVAVANTTPQTQLRVVHHEEHSGDEEEPHEETKMSAKKSKKLHHNK